MYFINGENKKKTVQSKIDASRIFPPQTAVSETAFPDALSEETHTCLSASAEHVLGEEIAGQRRQVRSSSGHGTSLEHGRARCGRVRLLRFSKRDWRRPRSRVARPGRREKRAPSPLDAGPGQWRRSALRPSESVRTAAVGGRATHRPPSCRRVNVRRTIFQFAFFHPRRISAWSGRPESGKTADARGGSTVFPKRGGGAFKVTKKWNGGKENIKNEKVCDVY